MDPNTRALIMGASGSTGPATYVEDVFSTYLYTGNGSTQTITNGIDLSGKGGLVWFKQRNGTQSNVWQDTARGNTKYLMSNATDAEYSVGSNYISSFNSNGFSLGSGSLSTNGNTYGTWTFRKAEKFFDVVTYTGTGTTQAIPHNLGSVPGMYVCKSISGTGDWNMYHRGLSGANYYIKLNSTDSEAVTGSIWNSVAPTATEFYVGNNNLANTAGVTYVAYLFAHDAGGFGDDGTESVIKCGSFTGPTTVNLGWEPQWVLIKRTDSNGSWFLLDTMRGFTASTTNPTLFANSTGGDSAADWGWSINATGFSGTVAASYIYIAIRRGPMKTPTDATKVFAPVYAISPSSPYTATTNFAVDLSWASSTSSGRYTSSLDRLRGGSTTSYALLNTSSAAAENVGSGSVGIGFQGNTSIVDNGFWAGYGLNVIYWNFRRAPGFFDVVAYTGTGSTQNVTHNLGVTPEMMIIKRRSSTGDWFVYSAIGIDTGKTYPYPRLNGNDDGYFGTSVINATAPTSSVFTISTSALNTSAATYIAYLFATCPGVSKVGSYTGTGTTLQVNCGFTAGARFVLIKRTDSTGDWYVWDTARGIISANDPYLLLNSTAAEVTGTDYIDPLSSGFQISSTAPAAINASGGSFIFLAVA